MSWELALAQLNAVPKAKTKRVPKRPRIPVFTKLTPKQVEAYTGPKHENHLKVP